MGSPTTRSDDRPGTILVTGGAGYIGSHAAKELAAAGRPVVIYDNLSQGHREAALGGDLVVGDTRDVPLLRSVIASRGVTAVMHFAAWAAVGDSVRDPAGYYENNVGGTLSVLRLPVSQYPSIAGPSIVIGAYYPGASAETAADTVVQIIEKEMTGLLPRVTQPEPL